MATITNKLLSVVIPVYNEQDNVALLTQKIHESLKSVQGHAPRERTSRSRKMLDFALNT